MAFPIFNKNINGYLLHINERVSAFQGNKMESQLD